MLALATTIGFIASSMTALLADVLLEPFALTLSAPDAPSAPALNAEPRSLILLGTATRLTALLALKHAARKDQLHHALTDLQ